MKKFKWLIGFFCLAVLLSACGGKANKNMSAPDKVPTCKIEAVEGVAHS